MSQWNHSQCERCWIRDYAILDDTAQPSRIVGVSRLPVRLKNGHGQIADPEPCCFCGEVTISGIQVRHDPKTLLECLGHEPSPIPMIVLSPNA